jgi:hypothetical protein
MKLFGRKREPDREVTRFDPARFEPVIRSSICTGEKVACMREKSTGKLQELMLIRSDEDLAAFCRRYRVKAEDVKTVY